MATALCAAVTSAATSSETHIVNQVGLTYDPEVVTVKPGDTIRWVHNGGTHDVANGADCNEFEEPIFPILPLTESNPVAEWTVPPAAYGEIPYFCSVSAHCQQGMTGTIIVEPPDGATIHVVEQMSVNFVPEEITVAPGDVVRWVWNNGAHTTTSGDNITCTPDDEYFNLLLDSQHREVLWVVPDDISEDVTYFCDPHCGFGHIGKILIDAPEPCIGDLNGDGSVNGADLTILLSAWGSDDPIADLNGDGIVNGADLTILLSNWGECL